MPRPPSPLPFVGIALTALASCGEDRSPPTSPPDPSDPPAIVEAPTETPNVVLITIESLRADHVGALGYSRSTTPRLDELAEEATLYSNAHSVTSWTLTSHASLFTGLYPGAHQVRRPTDRLADGYDTLAEYFQAHDYQTAAIVSGAYLSEKHGLLQGFDLVEQSPISPPGVSKHDDITNPRMEAALDRFFEQRDPQRPFFLFLYFWDPHFQYIPPPPYDQQFMPDEAEPIDDPEFGLFTRLGHNISPSQLAFLLARYDGEIACTDALLGRFFDRLRAEDLWEPTTLAVTADHGEQFFEHDNLGHKYGLHAESVHVPLLIKAAGQRRGGVDDRLVSLVDVMPSLLENAQIPPTGPQHGRSLFGPARGPQDPIFQHLISLWNVVDRRTGERHVQEKELEAVTAGVHKLIRNRERGGGKLYDRARDPGEREPLDERETKRVLRQELDRWRDDCALLARVMGEGAGAELSPAEIERLRSAGYTIATDDEASEGEDGGDEARTRPDPPAEDGR